MFGGRGTGKGLVLSCLVGRNGVGEHFVVCRLQCRFRFQFSFFLDCVLIFFFLVELKKKSFKLALIQLRLCLAHKGCDGSSYLFTGRLELSSNLFCLFKNYKKK